MYVCMCVCVCVSKESAQGMELKEGRVNKRRVFVVYRGEGLYSSTGIVT